VCLGIRDGNPLRRSGPSRCSALRRTESRERKKTTSLRRRRPNIQRPIAPRSGSRPLDVGCWMPARDPSELVVQCFPDESSVCLTISRPLRPGGKPLQTGGAFPRHERTLANPAPAVISNDPGFPNDAVTRDKKGHRVLCDGTAHSTGRSRAPDGRGQTPIGGELAGPDPQERAPDTQLKCCALHKSSQRPTPTALGRARENPFCHSGRGSVVTTQARVWPFRLQFGPRLVLRPGLDKRHMANAARALADQAGAKGARREAGLNCPARAARLHFPGRGGFQVYTEVMQASRTR
jgi:hypothetical protein